MLQHGGDLQRACREYGTDLADWVDLSTGINPLGWPVPEIPAAIWQRLPETPASLFGVAADYYGCTPGQLLPIPGSQALIQRLPSLIQATRVALPDPGYAEHRLAWQQAGADLFHYPADSDAKALFKVAESVELMLVINPNNPSGDRYTPELLVELARCMRDRQGWLVVDEAFIDLHPEQSLAAELGLGNLILLRSLGKFFGLAGARAGFLLGSPELLAQAAQALGPWPVSAPALYVSERALADRCWQQAARQRVRMAEQRLVEQLGRLCAGRLGCGGLFVTLFTPEAAGYHKQLAQQAIWTRLLDGSQGLRFGLPGDEIQWQRLEAALEPLS
ncbi:threonine-phosphate decarboxylase [Aestuariirhabdus litorea]|uniref:threonine-phosphate decarboxylase n=1 Tax=Aestuariirhabdus litorea TaxID=2528527 RepID=A0A3P3VRL3_9GAMM|nr:threonine-phosphate decarboxylase [Aestuariirhabdus litorea]RWW98645.1 threonine-phosphate decarboxylase [Endozoicomonadaceae bacterium GTF-13]